MLGRGAIAAIAVVFGGIVAGGTILAVESNNPSDNFGGQEFDIPDPAKGGRIGQLYIDNCASCHDEGVDRAPQRILFSYMSPQSIYRSLKDGKMKDQAAALSDADKIALAEFMTRRKISAASEAPEPPVCKGKAAVFDVSAP